MNELVALGVELTDVIRMVTVNAATVLGLTDELGSLTAGRVADVSVLAIDEDDWTLQDSLGVRIMCGVSTAASTPPASISASASSFK
jgi:dihydroorotase